MRPWIPGGLFCWAHKLYVRVKGMDVKGVNITHKSAFHRAHWCGELWEEGRREGRVGRPGGRN